MRLLNSLLEADTLNRVKAGNPLKEIRTYFSTLYQHLTCMSSHLLISESWKTFCIQAHIGAVSDILAKSAVKSSKEGLYYITVRSINIGTSTQFSSFWLYTPPQWIWNETNKTFSFNLRVFTSLSGERCRNYNSFYMCLPLFKGPKVMGQLAAQLFHGQVCVIPSLSHLQGADKRSRICWICCRQLSIWDPKSCHYQWSKPSLGTNRSER